MKTLSLILIIFVSFSFKCQSIRVQEESFDFLNAPNSNSLTVEIPYAQQNFVDAKIKRLFKGWGKHKESKGEHSSMLVEMKSMGKIPFNAYAKAVIGSNETIKVYFGFDLGGAFMSKRDHEEKYVEMEGLILSFAQDAVKDWISEELQNEEKVLSQLEKDQKELEKRKEHLEKEIKNFEQKISENEKEIADNIDSQSKKKTELDTQKKQVEKVSRKLKELN